MFLSVPERNTLSCSAVDSENRGGTGYHVPKHRDPALHSHTSRWVQDRAPCYRDGPCTHCAWVSVTRNRQHTLPLRPGLAVLMMSSSISFVRERRSGAPAA